MNGNNEVKDALDVLRRHMKDKSEGSLHHGWMCNIKFAVYDSMKPNKSALDACEDGANMFLDKLFLEEE